MFFLYKCVCDGSSYLFRYWDEAVARLWDDFLSFTGNFNCEIVAKAAAECERGYIPNIGAISIISIEDM